MKKIIASTALAAVLFAGSAHAKFEGAYAGVNTGYAWTKFNTSSKKDYEEILASEKNKINLKGMFLGTHAGYGANLNSIYVGGEARIGYNFAKSNKKNSLTEGTATYNYFRNFERKWSFGLVGKVGTHFTENMLGCFTFGVNYDTFKQKFGEEVINHVPVPGAISSLSTKNINVWSFTPGVSIDTKVTPDLSFGIGYEYSIPFKVTGLNKDFKFNKKPQTQTIRISVSYHF